MFDLAKITKGASQRHPFNLSTGLCLAIGTVSFVLMTTTAYADCASATITGNCFDLVLPSSAGDTDYVIGTDAIVSSSNTDPGGNIDAVDVGDDIGSLTNDGYINGGRANVGLLFSEGAFVSGNVINNGTVYTEDDTALLFLTGATLNGNFVNNGRIEGYSNDIDTDRWVYSLIFQHGVTFNGTVTNSATGVITSNSNHAVEIDTYISQFNNAGLIEHTASDDNNWGPAVGMFSGHVGVFNNSGTMTDSSTPLYGWTSGGLLLASSWQTPDEGSVIDTLNNSGEISVTNASYAQSGITVRSGSSIGAINNTGDIWTAGADYYGIQNFGTILHLNNYQGTNGSYGSALTYGGILPTYYNVIVDGDAYGQLAVDYNDHTGSLTFGVFAGDENSGVSASQLYYKTYVDVMTGVHVGDIDNQWAQTTTGDHRALGVYGSQVWMLRENQEDYSWNLEVVEPLGGTDALENQRLSDLQGKVDLGAGTPYDCRIDDNRSGCVALKGAFRSPEDGASAGSVAIIGSARLNESVRVGGFLEKDFAWHGSDYVDYAQSAPSLGAYLAVSQNPNDTGLQAKASFAMTRGEATLSRENLFGDAEMASGKAGAKGYSLAQTIGYGIALDKTAVLTPFMGVGFVSATRDAYTENSDQEGLDDVFTYAEYNRNATLSSVGVAYERNIPKGLSLRGGLGLSYVLASSSDNFAATSDLIGVETINATAVADQQKTVGVNAYLGAEHSISDDQKIGFGANVWRSVGSGDYGYTLMAGWTLNFGGAH